MMTGKCLQHIEYCYKSLKRKRVTTQWEKVHKQMISRQVNASSHFDFISKQNRAAWNNSNVRLVTFHNSGFQKWQSCWEWTRHFLTCSQSTQDVGLTCLDNNLPLGTKNLQLFKLILDLIRRKELDKPKLKAVCKMTGLDPPKLLKVTKDYKNQETCSRWKETKLTCQLNAIPDPWWDLGFQKEQILKDIIETTEEICTYVPFPECAHWSWRQMSFHVRDGHWRIERVLMMSATQLIRQNVSI